MVKATSEMNWLLNYKTLRKVTIPFRYFYFTFFYNWGSLIKCSIHWYRLCALTKENFNKDCTTIMHISCFSYSSNLHSTKPISQCQIHTSRVCGRQRRWHSKNTLQTDILKENMLKLFRKANQSFKRSRKYGVPSQRLEGTLCWGQ